jgi:hypothetical protein
MTLTPELLAHIRTAAEACAYPAGRPLEQALRDVVALMDVAPPTIILTLLERIAELEAALLEIAGGMARDDARDCAAAALRSST